MIKETHKISVTVLLILALLSLTHTCLSQNKLPVHFDIIMPSKLIHSYKDLEVQFNFTMADVTRVALLPVCMQYGYDFKVPYWGSNYLVLEVDKIVGKSYTKKGIKREIADDTGILCYDSTGKEMVNTLSAVHPVSYAKNLIMYYVFKKGRYRVRARFNFLKSKKPNTYLYSNWIYFEVKENEIPFPDFKENGQSGLK